MDQQLEAVVVAGVVEELEEELKNVGENLIQADLLSVILAGEEQVVVVHVHPIGMVQHVILDVLVEVAFVEEDIQGVEEVDMVHEDLAMVVEEAAVDLAGAEEEELVEELKRVGEDNMPRVPSFKRGFTRNNKLNKYREKLRYNALLAERLKENSCPSGTVMIDGVCQNI